MLVSRTPRTDGWEEDGHYQLSTFTALALDSVTCPAMQGQAEDVKQVNHLCLALFLCLDYCSNKSRLS